MARLPTLEAPNANELAWIADNVAKATELANKYGGDEATAPATLAGLDAVWVTLGTALRESGEDPNFFINMVGLAFGQYLVDTVGVAWVLATDEHGTEIAVHGQPGDILVYPTNFVAKRWESGEAEFLAQVGSQMVADISRQQSPPR